MIHPGKNGGDPSFPFRLNLACFYNIMRKVIETDFTPFIIRGTKEEVQAMSITVKDVQHVAKLARLNLTPEEEEMFTGQLNAILHYAEKLNELDTDGVEPTTHVLHLSNVMREDEVRESLPIEKVLLNAPDEEDDQFKVPAVLE